MLVVHHAFRPEGAVQILEVGASLPWSTSALGKAIVAFAPEPELAGLLRGDLQVLTGWSITDRTELAGQLEEVRQTGYAFEDQESALGDAGIAAPVFDSSGLVAGAIGIIGPVERVFADGVRSAHAVAVREVARNISRELGAGRGTAAPGVRRVS